MKTEAEATPVARQGFFYVSQAQFWGCLVVALIVFFFASGPLWRHAADIGQLDTAIYRSYLIIPVLIGGCLIASRRWSLRGFLLDSMALAVVKYVVTASIAIGLWALEGEPQRVAVASTAHAHPAEQAAEPAIVPTVIDPATTGAITVDVRDAAGSPVEGAIVYVVSGLERYVFAPPDAPLVVSNDGAGIAPKLSVVEARQAIQGRSLDGRLHTMVVQRDGAALFNVPLLSSGAPTTVRASDAPGLATVRCNVHPTEAQGRMLVVNNPFHGSTDATGAATLRGVPAGTVRVAVLAATGSAAAQVTAERSGVTRLSLTVAPLN